MKKLIALLLVVLLLFTLAGSAFADIIIEPEPDPENPDAGMTDGDHGGQDSGESMEYQRRLYESLIDAAPFNWGEGGTGTYDIGDGTRNYTLLADTLRTLKKKGLKTLKFNMKGNEYEISMADLLDNLSENGSSSVTTKLDGRDGLKLVGSAKTRDGIQEYTIAVLRPIEAVPEEVLRTPVQSAVVKPDEAQAVAVQPDEAQNNGTPPTAEQSAVVKPAEAQSAAVQPAGNTGTAGIENEKTSSNNATEPHKDFSKANTRIEAPEPSLP